MAYDLIECIEYYDNSEERKYIIGFGRLKELKRYLIKKIIDYSADEEHLGKEEINITIALTNRKISKKILGIRLILDDRIIDFYIFFHKRRTKKCK